MIDYEKANEMLYPRLLDYLVKAHGTNPKKMGGKWKFNCPCKAHADADGENCEYHEDSKTFICHSRGCTNARGTKGWNIFDIASEDINKNCKTDFDEVCSHIARTLGLTLPTKTDRTPIATKVIAEKPKPQDQTKYIIQCEANLSKGLAYLNTRGFVADDLPTLQKLRVGWDDTNKRLILPFVDANGINVYQSRLTTSIKQRYSMTQNAVKKPTYCEQISGEKPILITEGQINAISLWCCGYDAISMLDCHNGHDWLVEWYQNKHTTQPIIIMFDNDKAGQDGAKLLSEKLNKAHIYNYISLLGGVNEDINNLFRADREKMIQTINATLEYAKNGYYEWASRNGNDLDKWECNRMSNKSVIIAKEIDNAIPPIQTHIDAVDNMLNGGLRKGLYVIGAVCGGGKTALCMQIADNIAQSGRKVVYFSLEMGGVELFTRSISRLSAQIDLEEQTKKLNNGERCIAVSRDAITSTYLAEGHRSNTERGTIILNRSVSEYQKSIAPNLFVIEGGFEPTTGKSIREQIDSFVGHYGDKPIVFVDYLQLCADPNTLDYRRAIDETIRELKLLSNEYAIPVVIISSLARSSYNSTNSVGVYKESGLIEYTADVCIQMSWNCMRDSKDGAILNIEKYKKYRQASSERNWAMPLNIAITKNRKGNVGEKVVAYYVKFNYIGDEWTEKYDIFD